MRYAVAGLIWSAIGAGVAALFSTHYYDQFSKLAPHRLVLTLFIVFWILLLIPLLMQLLFPLFRRARYGRPEVNRVIR